MNNCFNFFLLIANRINRLYKMQSVFSLTTTFNFIGKPFNLFFRRWEFILMRIMHITENNQYVSFKIIIFSLKYLWNTYEQKTLSWKQSFSLNLYYPRDNEGDLSASTKIRLMQTHVKRTEKENFWSKYTHFLFQ